MQRGCRLGNMTEGGGLYNLSVDGRIVLVFKWFLKQQDGKAWIGFSWIIIEINGGTVVNTVMKFRVPSNVGHVWMEELII